MKRPGVSDGSLNMFPAELLLVNRLSLTGDCLLCHFIVHTPVCVLLLYVILLA